MIFQSSIGLVKSMFLMIPPKDWFALHDEFFYFVPICYQFIINKKYIDVQ
jgi:hypothetical protein